MLIDAHSHLDFYGKRLDAALAEIESLGIVTLAVAMDPESFEQLLAIAARSHYVVPTFGIHPWRAADHHGQLDDLLPQIRQSPMIGEIGLDYHWQKDRATDSRQREVFDFFLRHADEQNKSVNLHTKGAEEEVLAALGKYNIPNPIVHWYSGPLEFVEEYLALGAYFTISVDLERSSVTRDLLATVPRDRLLTETDNPGGYQWFTQEMGMPALISDVVGGVARELKMTPAAVRKLVATNFRNAMSHSPELTHWFRQR